MLGPMGVRRPRQGHKAGVVIGIAHRLAVLIALASTACHNGPRGQSVARPPADELLLYRDRALVMQRIDVVIPEADQALVRFAVPAGVTVEDVAIIDPGALSVGELSGPSEPTPRTPTSITFVANAPSAGHYSLTIGYITDRIRWDVAYTMITTPARQSVAARGAITIRNDLGTALQRHRTYVVDHEVGDWRAEAARTVDPAKVEVMPRRALGELDLSIGESRFELMPGDPVRAMRSVLVFDPIGGALDHPGTHPLVDPTLGARTITAPAVESFEVDRGPNVQGMPAGPVRLLERKPDASLTALAQTTLFDKASKIAAVDWFTFGAVKQGEVTGTRERRELTVDEQRGRLVEEFVVTLKSTRSTPTSVVVREHLYRGQNWTLAYHAAATPTKDGPQQISLRAIVPANGETKVFYVVVYTGL
jgi:hypothetical protein